MQLSSSQHPMGLRHMSSNTFSPYTYWSHPESDCVFTMTQAEVENYSFTEPLDEIVLEDYLSRVQKPSELPEDVKGILKNARWASEPFPKEVLYGELWFNPQNQFPNGIGVHTSRITEVRADGVYCSLHSKYFVQFAPGQENQRKV